MQKDKVYLEREVRAVQRVIPFEDSTAGGACSYNRLTATPTQAVQLIPECPLELG